MFNFRKKEEKSQDALLKEHEIYMKKQQEEQRLYQTQNEFTNHAAKIRSDEPEKTQQSSERVSGYLPPIDTPFVENSGEDGYLPPDGFKRKITYNGSFDSKSSKIIGWIILLIFILPIAFNVFFLILSLFLSILSLFL